MNSNIFTFYTVLCFSLCSWYIKYTQVTLNVDSEHCHWFEYVVNDLGFRTTRPSVRCLVYKYQVILAELGSLWLLVY